MDQTAELAIVELAVRVVVQERGPSPPIFLSYRPVGTDPKSVGLSPPPEFFDRLSDLEIEVLPRSEMRVWRADRNPAKEQGESSTGYLEGSSSRIDIVKWYSASEAEVTISVSRGLFAEGFTTNVKRIDGEWQMYKPSRFWTT